MKHTFIFLGIAVTAVVAALAMLFLFKPHGGSKPVLIPAGAGGLDPKKTYYAYVSEIELQDKDADGKKWDKDTSGPDIYYKIRWRGSIVLESDVRADTFIGRWGGAGVSIGRIIKSGGKLDMCGLKQAAAVRPGPADDEVALEVFDDDGVACKPDQAGHKTIRLSSLQPGMNEIGAFGQVKRATIFVEEAETAP